MRLIVGKKPLPGSDKSSIASYFFVLLNVIALGIQQIILDYYTTDG